MVYKKNWKRRAEAQRQEAYRQNDTYSSCSCAMTHDDEATHIRRLHTPVKCPMCRIKVFGADALKAHLDSASCVSQTAENTPPRLNKSGRKRRLGSTNKKTKILKKKKPIASEQRKTKLHKRTHLSQKRCARHCDADETPKNNTPAESENVINLSEPIATAELAEDRPGTSKVFPVVQVDSELSCNEGDDRMEISTEHTFDDFAHEQPKSHASSTEKSIYHSTIFKTANDSYASLNKFSRSAEASMTDNPNSSKTLDNQSFKMKPLKAYQCEVCYTTYSYKSSLLRHLDVTHMIHKERAKEFMSRVQEIGEEGITPDQSRAEPPMHDIGIQISCMTCKSKDLLIAKLESAVRQIKTVFEHCKKST